MVTRLSPGTIVTRAVRLALVALLTYACMDDVPAVRSDLRCASGGSTMKKMLAKRKIMAGLGLVLGAFTLGVVDLASAQINDPSVSNENIELLKGSQPVLEYALAGAFLLAALAIGFKPSKRNVEKGR